jgi:hypothetical protein
MIQPSQSLRVAGRQPQPMLAPTRPGRRLLSVIVRVLFGLCGLLVSWLGLAARPVADVSPTGAFQTSVAIKVPPSCGLEPRLGLSHSSSTPNGWTETGWRLTGLPRSAARPFTPFFSDANGDGGTRGAKCF